MCYISDDSIPRKTGRLTETDCGQIAKALFHRALKLQIGCAAEPTITYDRMLQLIRLGKQYKVPYISVTSNGALITEERLREMAQSGLNELTLSLHGIKRETYEYMMGAKGRYDHFVQLLGAVKTVKQDYPNLKLRINYTMNEDNVKELADFDTLFADIPLDILQLRPIQKLGESEYDNFDLTTVKQSLETIVRPLAKRLQQRGVMVIAPEDIHIENIESKQESDLEQFFYASTYCNVSPTCCWQEDFDYKQENFEQYASRHHFGRIFFRSIFQREKTAKEKLFTMLPANYGIN